MIHPSYNELLEAINTDNDASEKPVLNSRYSLCIATAKRARQIINGSQPLVTPKCNKPLSIAIDEIYDGKVSILGEDEQEEEYQEIADEFYSEELPSDEQ